MFSQGKKREKVKNIRLITDKNKKPEFPQRRIYFVKQTIPEFEVIVNLENKVQSEQSTFQQIQLISSSNF